jgi:biopolymer transport protein ExbB/TolQ
MWWLWIPIGIVGSVLVLFLLLLILGRVRNGALLRPVVLRLARIAFMQRFFQRISTAQMERSNPELAGAIRKLNTVASNPNPQAVQKAMSRLTPAERRAYMEAAQEQGAIPDSANRQMRRQAERMQQQARGGRPGSGSSRKRKRR